MIKPGIYDNTATMRREVYHSAPNDGEAQLVDSVSAELIETKPEYGGLAGRVRPWGRYPPLERVDSVRNPGK